jgi:hypothetical protein
MMADKLEGLIILIPLVYLLFFIVAWRVVRKKFP